MENTPAFQRTRGLPQEDTTQMPYLDLRMRLEDKEREEGGENIHKFGPVPWFSFCCIVFCFCFFLFDICFVLSVVLCGLFCSVSFCLVSSVGWCLCSHNGIQISQGFKSELDSVSTDL